MTVVTLTTDFGLGDAYVAAMKGVILSINPKATVVDVCHTISPQNITQAAYILSTATSYFPDGSVHVAVVDPGVGTKRRPVLLVTPKACFVGPDNGVFNYVTAQSHGQSQAFEITNPAYWLSPISATFHGRDIFAPVAAHLSLGVPPHEIGIPTSSSKGSRLSRPKTADDGTLTGRVIHVDHFGNLITDIMKADMPKGRVFIEVFGHIIDDVSTSYEDEEGLLALFGSDARLEVSVTKGSAASYLGAKIGDEVKVGPSRTSLRGGM
ncbi:MAG: SAM-dependent chlorinase/fluorinase [Chloroflexota bacterium]|nr:SAM-dependent chlorinase/fluorinase [Chloroflexota bacterium]